MLEPTKPNVIYLNVKRGAIVHKTAQGQRAYKNVTGIVKTITRSTRVFNGENVTYWYINLVDPQTNENYALSFPYSSGAFRSLIMQLVSDEGIEAVKSQTPITISVYLKDNYTKLQVYVNNFPLQWIDKKLPPAKVVNIGSKEYKDDSARMLFVEQYVNDIVDLCKAIKRVN